MNRIELKRNDINENNEIIEETYYELHPDNGKCFQNKKTKHKFIHNKTNKGLPLYVTEEEISLYDEVRI